MRLSIGTITFSNSAETFDFDVSTFEMKITEDNHIWVKFKHKYYDHIEDNHVLPVEDDLLKLLNKQRNGSLTLNMSFALKNNQWFSLSGLVYNDWTYVEGLYAIRLLRDHHLIISAEGVKVVEHG